MYIYVNVILRTYIIAYIIVNTIQETICDEKIFVTYYVRRTGFTR